jgi:hypothetical protein
MEPEENPDTGDGPSPAKPIDHWGDELGTEGEHTTPEHFGDQEEEASKERLTPKYFLDKASEKAKIWTWFGGVAGPAWLVLIIFLAIWSTYLLI